MDSGTSFLDLREGLNQAPPVTLFQHAFVPKVPKHVHQEQWIAFRSVVYEVDQIVPERVTEKL